MKSKLKSGPKPRIQDIKKAHKLKEAGLSFSQIAWAILKRDDKKTIYRWLKLDVGKL